MASREFSMQGCHKSLICKSTKSVSAKKESPIKVLPIKLLWEREVKTFSTISCLLIPAAPNPHLCNMVMVSKKNRSSGKEQKKSDVHGINERNSLKKQESENLWIWLLEFVAGLFIHQEGLLIHSSGIKRIPYILLGQWPGPTCLSPT